VSGCIHQSSEFGEEITAFPFLQREKETDMGGRGEREGEECSVHLSPSTIAIMMMVMASHDDDDDDDDDGDDSQWSY